MERCADVRYCPACNRSGRIDCKTPSDFKAASTAHGVPKVPGVLQGLRRV